jgi:hypothetical protein
VANSDILLFASANSVPSAEFVIDDVPAGTHPLVEIVSAHTSHSEHFEFFVTDFTVVVVEGRTTDWREPASLQRARIQTDRASLFRTAEPG